MPQTPSRTVLIVERDRAIARQIQTCLAFAGFSVPTPVWSVADALDIVADMPPDVVVADIAMAGDDEDRRGLGTMALEHGIPIVYLSAAADHATIERAADAYAAAYILKPFNERQLVSAVMLAAMAAERAPLVVPAPRPLTLEEKLRAIAAVINDDALASDERPLARVRSTTPAAVPHDESLSNREREIVDLLANGARVITIAQQLALSPHTVRNHLKSVFRKLNLRGQHELFEYWRGQHAV